MNCGKCHGSFQKEGHDPLLLPACGHTLCRSCLKLYTQHNGFKCHNCGMKQPKVNLEDLKPNFALLDIIASMNDENMRPGKKERFRSRGRAAAADKIREREESIRRGVEIECVEHDGVRLTYWCGPCGVAACGECVVDNHIGGKGGRRHMAVKIDEAVKTRRNELEDIVLDVTRALDTAEEKRTNFAKSSPFVAGAKKLHCEVGAVWGKMRIVAALLACLIQESEDGGAELRQLRQELDKLIQKAPQSTPTAGGVAEIRALLKHLQSLESFRDGPVSKALKQVEVLDREDRQSFLTSASVHTAVLNVKAAALCRQVAGCGDGGNIEVVGSAGLVGSLAWEEKRLHLHCLRHPSLTQPRKPLSDPSRRHALKWAMVQTQLHEVSQVFLVLARGTQGQAGAVRERIYLKLHRPDSSISSTDTACHIFLHLLMGDDGTNSLLGSLTVDVQLSLGVKAILLGKHHQEEGDGEDNTTKEGAKEDAATKTDSNPTTASHPVNLDAGDVICVKGRERNGDTEFWLVTETATKTVKPLTACEVVGTLLPSHKSLLAKLQSLKGLRVEDCGAVLSTESEVKGVAHASPAAPSARVSPSVHPKNAAEGFHKPQNFTLSYNDLDEFC